MKKNAPTLVSALENREYRRFIKERDLVLEDLLYKTQLRQTGIMRHSLFELMLTLRKSLDSGKVQHKTIEAIVRGHLNPTVLILAQEAIRLRRQAFTLAGIGEAEALARLTGSGTYNFASSIVDQSGADRKIEAFIRHYVSKLEDRIVDKIYLSNNLREETPMETIQGVISILPRVRKVKKPPKVLPRQLEAGGSQNPTKNFALGAVDDRTWDSIVRDYLDEEIPKTRGPEDVIDKRTLPKEYQVLPKEQVYAWDVENQITEDFVSAVRAGQIEAANQNGFDDGIWIAIIDNRTDECCIWRDGLLTSEIEYELNAGSHQGDACTASVPPAHFKCRCRWSPAISTDLLDVKSNAGEFIDWLKSP